ncbi:MAG TPA: ABC transporter ATP-binding protein [Gemmatimonadaceae bacterium]|nr:ABC transporter ATP-binding protein [Gemmatimonadaceae bacterium]
MIDLSNISKQYAGVAGSPAVHALTDLSLRIERGEFVAITGTSGSGKSTLLNILGLLDAPTSGRYLFDGQDVSGLSVAESARFRNRRVGFVFQSFHLLARTSALENVELPLLYSDRASIDGLGQRALEAVGLADRMSHTPSQLSGGQQQRVAIARALVNEPDFLLADEPTGNLDAQSAEEIMTIFRSLNDAGRTVILVTHDPNMARFAQRIVRLDRGRVVSPAPALQEAR